MDNFDLKKYLSEGRLLKEAVIWNWDGDRNSLEQVPPKFKLAVKAEFEGELSDEEFEEAFDAVKNFHADEAGRGSMKFNSDHWAEMIEMDYLEEGSSLKENQSPKFKIGDFVQPKVGSTMYFLRDRGTIKDKKKYIGQIENVPVNKPENLRTKDGEYLYAVQKLNHRGKDAMSFDFKESDLESIPNPTDYIQSLQPYKRRN